MVTTEVAIGVVATGASVVAEATAGLVPAVGEVVTAVVGATGAVPHGATVTEPQDAMSKFLIRPNSL